VPPWAQYALIFASTLWMALDASRLKLKKYKTVLAGNSAWLFIIGLLLWIPIFPWYLYIRYKIKRGELPLASSSGNEMPKRKKIMWSIWGGAAAAILLSMASIYISNIARQAIWLFLIMPILSFGAGLVSIVGFSDYLRSRKKSSWWAVAASPVLIFGEMFIGFTLGAILSVALAGF
jgi:hypothetical protein